MRKIFLPGSILLIGIVVLFFAIKDRIKKVNQEKIEYESIIDTVIFQPRLLFGLKVDSFLIQSSRIKRNQFMAGILNQYGVADSVIYMVSQKSKDIIDLRSIKGGDKYTLFFKNDPTGLLNYLVYEPNELDYYIFKLTSPVLITRGMNETDTLRQFVSGIVENSLWESIQNQGASPELVFMLAEVFAWQIDFYRLQKGDRFKVLFDQININNEPYKIDQINAAWFGHGEEKYYAFRFNRDSITGFFDESGNSLRRQLLKTPLKFYRISSRYSRNRFHPVQHRYKAHLGTDYAAPAGTPIRSVGDGIITEANYSKFNGKYVKIRHNGIYTTQYLHMSKFASDIRNGVKVKQGQVIGYVGSTGLSTGPHVCFRFWKDGVQVDAQKIVLPPTDPIPPVLKDEYNSLMDPLRAKLDSI